MNARQIASLVHGRPAGKGRYQAKCPAHEDRNPSLSISEGRDRRVLLKCHAGCELKDILEKLGLTVADINGGADNAPRRQRSTFNIDKTYDYKDVNGTLLYQVVRLFPKSFRQRRPDGLGRWISNLDGVQRVLFNLSKVLAADVVLIVEGEKDVLTLEKAAEYFAAQDGCSYAATTNSGGAGKWLDEYSQCLEGKKLAYIFPDNDSPGRKHAQNVYASIIPHVKRVCLVDLPGLKPHGDVSDWLREHSVQELWQVMQSALLGKPPLREEASRPPNDGRTDRIQAAVQDRRPKVRLPGNNYLLSETAAELSQHLVDKLLFVRNGEIVALEGNELKVISPQTFRTLVELYVICYRKCYRKLEGEDKIFEVDSTMTVNEAGGILASPQFAKGLRLVVRLNLCRLPALRDDGKIELLQEGYDSASNTLTLFTAPYADDISFNSAVAIIDDLFGEFIFADGPRSKAVAVAALMSMFCPLLLPAGALRPCFVFNKNAPGAGAGTLVACCVAPILGEIPIGSKPTEDDEMRKLLSAVVREGKPVLILDNLKGKLSSPSLEGFISASTYEGRLLGTSATFKGPNLATVFVTTNGCKVSQDMGRRSLFVDLHLAEERPEDRVFERPLNLATLLKLRPKILAACWAFVRNWDTKGRPSPSRSHSAFPEWARVISGIVEAAGYGCALDIAEVAAMADEIADSMRALAAVMDLNRHYDFAEIVTLCQKHEAFTSIVGSTEMDNQARSRLGWALGRYDHRHVGDRFFVIEGKGHKRRFWVQ